MSWSIAEEYHDATKHHFHRYARGPHGLDWSSQPDPFRRFPPAPLVQLPLSQADDSPPWDALDRPGQVAPRPVDLRSVGLLLEHSLAITAWKELRGSRWALRANPSSGNLHPTEGYLVLPALAGLHTAPAVWHYVPEAHALERRLEFSSEDYAALLSGFPAGTFLTGVSSIHWREAWKYGERAYRYCQHDAGHALAALRMAAAMLGWGLKLLEGPGDAAVARLLGLDRAGDFPRDDRETPAFLAALSPTGRRSDPTAAPPSAAGSSEVDSGQSPNLPEELVATIAGGTWIGRANALGVQHVAWPIIDRVSAACGKPEGCPSYQSFRRPAAVDAARPFTCPSASRIIKTRRSAVDMDGRSGLSGEAFHALLARLLPAEGRTPWDAVAWPPAVSLALFVHRVAGFVPGLYALVRTPDHEEPLRRALRPAFVWQKPAGSSADLPLYLLAEGDARRIAAQVSCHQEIAGDGAFSVAMLAEWDARKACVDGWFYRRLFWETGMIGQMLYLEAEAAGLRGTGIGCYFDDPVHQLLGIGGRPFQDLYHFTVGGPVDDPRLTTLPPYGDRTAPL